jgi:FtsH-binding integral membrane protein
MTMSFKSAGKIRLQAAGDISGSPARLANASNNLVVHILGEASGFYLMSVEAFSDASMSHLGLVFVLSIVLLVLVRWVAGATKAVLVTSLTAFVIWMFVLENGFFHALMPDVLPNPLGLIIAAFYSAVVTILATSGKLE